MEKGVINKKAADFMEEKGKLISNLDKIHTTEWGKERIKKNLCFADVDVVDWCIQQIQDTDNVFALHSTHFLLYITFFFFNRNPFLLSAKERYICVLKILIMKRRDFLRTGVIMGAGAVASLHFDKLQAALHTNTIAVEAIPDLVAVMGGEPEAMLDKALETLGGIGNFVKKGQKIVIKPNIGWDRAPELAGNTNPKLMGALVKKCLDAGASKVTVFDHTCDDWRKCYASSGIESAVKAAGGVIVPGNDEKYYSTEIPLPNGVSLKSIKVHDALMEADAWINVPILKNHGGAKLSCAMKNLMGIVWDRRFFHSNDLQQCIADICTWNKKPVLNIVDSYRMLFQNGPQGKSAADVATVKTLIASKDIVATDTAALQFFNQVKKLDLNAVKHIEMGQSHKLGTTDLKNINIKRIKI